MPSNNVADWTVMIYMNVEASGFDISFLRHLQEMNITGSTKEINIILLIDRAPKSSTNGVGTYQRKYHYPSIYRVRRNQKILPKTIALNVIENEDFGSSDVLEQFLTYTKRKFPAKRFMLTFWDHGAGNSVTTSANESIESFSSRVQNRINIPIKQPRRLGTLFRFPTGMTSNNPPARRDTYENEFLYIKEIQTSIRKVFNRKQKIDLVAFDACWMQMFETAYGLKDSVKYLVASENLISYEGFGYFHFFEELTSSPQMTTLEVAKLLIKSSYLKDSDPPIGKRKEIQDSYNKVYDDPRITLSCLRLDKALEVSKKIDELARLFVKKKNIFYKHIKIARFLCLSFFDEESPADYDLKVIDFIYFLKKLIAVLTDAFVIIPKNKKDESAKAIQLSRSIITICELTFIADREIGSTMMEEKETEKKWGAHGFSIFFPEHAFEWDNYKLEAGWYFENDEKISMQFADENYWKQFLDDYFREL